MEKDGKTKQRAARSARLAAALRENLKRRKAQARGRAGTHAGAEDRDVEPSGLQQSGVGQSPAAADTPDFRRNRGRE